MPIHSLSKDLVSAISSQYPGLEALNLSQNKISQIQNLEPLTSLTKLDLSSNQITAADNLHSLSGLQELYLQANNISRVSSSIGELKELNTLNLGANQLKDLDRLVQVLGELPNLRQLSLSGNPCAQYPNYIRAVADSCRSLTVLDGVPLVALLRSTTAAEELETSSRQPLMQLNGVNPSSAARISSQVVVKQPAHTQSIGTAVCSELELATDARHSNDDVGLPISSTAETGHPSTAQPQPSGPLITTHDAAMNTDPQYCISPDEGRLRGEADALKQQLAEARAESQHAKLLVGQLVAERDCALEQLAASDETVAKLRSYIGQSACDSLPKQGATAPAMETDLDAQGGRDEHCVPTEVIEPTVAILERQIQALQEIIDTQEAQIMEHGPEAGAELLCRWRQEVFKGIVARRAAELQAVEATRAASARVGHAAEAARHAERAAQIAQQKAVTHQIELVRKSATISELKDELQQRQEDLDAAQEKAAGLHSALLALTGEAKAAEKAAAALEYKVEAGDKQLAALSGRLHFAEQRMKVLSSLRRHGSKPCTGTSLGTQCEDPSSAQSGLRQLLPAGAVGTEVLEREVTALQQEREVLLRRLQDMEGEMAVACQEAAARVKQEASEELQSALEVQKAAFEESIAARAAHEVIRQQEAEQSAQDRISSLAAEREKAQEQVQELKQELRTLQGDLAAANLRVDVLVAELESNQSDLQALTSHHKEEKLLLDQRQKDAEARHREEVAILRAEYEENHRQGAKAVITVRQLERQIARLQAKQQSCTCDDFQSLEQKLREKDAALRAVRRERNALLAAQRDGGGGQEATPAAGLHVTKTSLDSATPLHWHPNAVPSETLPDKGGARHGSKVFGAAVEAPPSPPRTAVATVSRPTEQPALFDRLTELENLTESLLDDL